jgi:hypothetical protein
VQGGRVEVGRKLYIGAVEVLSRQSQQTFSAACFVLERRKSRVF